MMGIDLGSLLIVLALALMAVSPLHVTISRPKPEPVHAEMVLREAYPVPAPVAELDALVREADAALARDPLIRATAAIAETYDRA